MANDADGRVSIPFSGFGAGSLLPLQVGGTNIHGYEDEDDAGGAFSNSLTQQELDERKAMNHSDYIYARLVDSVPPTVYGHDVIKKGCCSNSWVVATNKLRRVCTSVSISTLYRR